MSSMAEQIARKESAELFDPDYVTVKVKTSWHMGFCLPDENGNEEESAIFATMTFGDNYVIDKATAVEVKIGERIGGEDVVSRTTDINEYKRLLVKRSLLSWSLDIPIERDSSGWMTSDSYKRVANVPAPLLDAFVRKFEESVEVSDEEEHKIARQCAVLFSKNGHGVTDACEAVSLFCTLGNFSEKFGITKEMLPRMSYKEFLLLKIMIGKESDALRIQHKPSGGGNTKIMGAGGKTKASRGVRIPMPGSGGG